MLNRYIIHYEDGSNINLLGKFGKVIDDNKTLCYTVIEVEQGRKNVVESLPYVKKVLDF